MTVRHFQRGWYYLFALAFIVRAAQLLHIVRTQYFLFADPYWMMWATRSLAEDGDLDLRNQFEFLPERISDQIALGSGGEWYPLHEPLICYLALPFFKVFGTGGLLLFNVLIACGIICVGYSLARQYCSTRASALASILCGFGGTLFYYFHSFSIDVLGAFFALLAFRLSSSGRASSAGAVLGFAFLARNFNFIYVPAILWRLLADKPKKAQLSVRFALGLLPFLLLLGVENFFLFGSITTFSYERWAHYENEMIIVASQGNLFSIPNVSRIGALLFDIDTGLLCRSPFIVVALLFGTKTLWSQRRHEVISAFLAFGLAMLFFGSYGAPFPGTGNRYLLTVSVLFAPFLACALQDAVRNQTKPL